MYNDSSISTPDIRCFQMYVLGYTFSRKERADLQISLILEGIFQIFSRHQLSSSKDISIGNTKRYVKQVDCSVLSNKVEKIVYTQGYSLCCHIKPRSHIARTLNVEIFALYVFFRVIRVFEISAKICAT